jgi:hypothetical protein
MFSRTVKLFGIAAVTCTLVAAGSLGYKSYSNDKYGYTVSYPVFLNPQGEPDAQDGQRFASQSSPLTMSVWGTYSNWQNGEEMTLADQRSWELKNLARNARVSYQATGKNWFVCSGTKGDAIFYQRTIKRPDVFASVLLEYPNNKKQQFATVVQTVARSLK